MIWPFRKVEKVPFEDYVNSRPIAPCGKQKEHVYWTEFERLPCPICKGIEKRKEALEAEDRMARKIAAYVAQHCGELMMRKKFKIYYSADNPDPEKAGKRYKPPGLDMLVMNSAGVFFVFNGEPYYPSISPLVAKIGNYDVVWGEN